MNILVVYGTSHGYTAKVVGRITERLRIEGHEVDLFNAKETPPDLQIARYDEVIIAASMNSGHFQSEVVEFVKLNCEELDRRPNVFLAVSLSVAYESEKNLEKYRGQLDGFFRETGWRPQLMLDVAGAIPRSVGTGIMRLIWRVLVGRRKTGIPTGKSSDPQFAYEFSDWDAINQFMRDAMVLAERSAENRAAAVHDS